MAASHPTLIVPIALQDQSPMEQPQGNMHSSNATFSKEKVISNSLGPLFPLRGAPHHMGTSKEKLRDL